jgi:SAM-dependent methyltransferase
MRIRLSHLIGLPRLKYARRYFANRRISILDVGCGNHSPSLTKYWFPLATYHGVDIQEFNIGDDDKRAMDRFFKIAPDLSGQEAVPNEAYDFVVINHVLEHVRDQERFLAVWCAKLKPGGLIWIAFPSRRSLSLPSAEGTLNFCDDPTHVRLPSVREVANILLDNGVSVVVGGRSHDSVQWFLGALMLPVALLRRLVTGRLHADLLRYISGFEDRVIGRKIESPVGGSIGRAA